MEAVNEPLNLPGPDQVIDVYWGGRFRVDAYIGKTCKNKI